MQRRRPGTEAGGGRGGGTGCPSAAGLEVPSSPFPPCPTGAASARPGQASPARVPSLVSLSGPSRGNGRGLRALSRPFPPRGSMSDPRFSLHRSGPARPAPTPLPSPSSGMAAAPVSAPHGAARPPARKHGVPGARAAALLPGCESWDSHSPPAGRRGSRGPPPAGQRPRSPSSPQPQALRLPGEPARCEWRS